MLFKELGYALRLEYAYSRYVQMNGPRSRQEFIDYRTWMDRFCE